MKKQFLFIGIGAAILLYFLSKSSAAKNLKIYFQTLSLKKSKGFNFPTVQAVFRIVNPTSSTLTIDSIAGDITVNDKFLSSLSQIDPISIPANSETLYTINIKTYQPNCYKSHKNNWSCIMLDKWMVSLASSLRSINIR